MKQQSPITINLKTVGFVNFYFPKPLPAVAEDWLEKRKSADSSIDSSYPVGYLSAVLDDNRYFAIVSNTEGVAATLADAAAMVKSWDESNDEPAGNIEAIYRNTPKIPPEVFDAISYGTRLNTKKGTEAARLVLVDGMKVSEAAKLTGRQQTHTQGAIERVCDIFWAISPLLK